MQPLPTLPLYVRQKGIALPNNDCVSEVFRQKGIEMQLMQSILARLQCSSRGLSLRGPCISAMALENMRSPSITTHHAVLSSGWSLPLNVAHEHAPVT